MIYVDNTRVSAYRKCPRYFFFRHQLHLRRDGPAYPELVFGGSWHNAMDVVWGLAAGDKTDSEILEIAYAAFCENWVAEGLPEPTTMDLDTITRFEPRTPGIAREMLHNYIKARRPFLKNIELLSIETPFAVPLDPDRSDIFYIGKRDKDFRYQDRVHIGEHKTTSWYAKATGFRQEWMETFSPNAQVEGYLHSAHMQYGAETKSVWIDGSLVHKQVHDKFKFLLIDRNLAGLEEWRQDTLDWVDQLQRDKDKYNAGTHCFRRNTDSCFSYGKPCAFLDFCRFHNDPLSIDPAEPPEGFVVDKWDPVKELEISDKLGLPTED